MIAICLEAQQSTVEYRVAWVRSSSRFSQFLLLTSLTQSRRHLTRASSRLGRSTETRGTMRPSSYHMAARSAARLSRTVNGDWLTKKSATQLEEIAIATGFPSSGTKKLLIERLRQCAFQCALSGHKGTESRSRRVSLLSIDMGIRNLAFAHITIDPLERADAKGISHQSPVLQTWNRLDVSALGHDEQSHDLHLSSRFGTSSSSCQEKESTEETSLEQESNVFAPENFARRAYSLLISMITTFKPTHILIERQRFRSAGGSAVQEWTLRVGMFESMLYAILHTLQQEQLKRSLKTNVEFREVHIEGVDPKRVLRYWINPHSVNVDNGTTKSKRIKSKKPTNPDATEIDDLNDEQEAKGKTRKKGLNAREGKKAKIDTVQCWLNSLSKKGMATSSSTGKAPIVLGSGVLTRQVSEAFLTKCNKPRARSSRNRTTTESRIDIGKLDDLADCLLQGVAWWQWQFARGEIARLGDEFDLQSLPGRGHRSSSTA